MNKFFQFLAGILPGVDDLISFITDLVQRKDDAVKFKYGAIPATIILKRILTIAAVALLIAGFVGALAVPIPGVAPLYTLTVASVFKAIGITIGYAAIARTIGSFFGSCIDKARLYFNESMRKVSKQINPFKIAFAYGFFGELGTPVMSGFVSRVKNFLLGRENSELSNELSNRDEPDEEKDPNFSSSQGRMLSRSGSFSSVVPDQKYEENLPMVDQEDEKNSRDKRKVSTLTPPQDRPNDEVAEEKKKGPNPSGGGGSA